MELQQATGGVRREAGRDVFGLPVRTWPMHRAQAAVWNSRARTKVVVCGRRWGKSEFAAMWVIQLAMGSARRGVSGLIWVVEPTYKHCRTAWRKILKLCPRGWITKVVGTEEHPGTIVILGRVRIEFWSAENPGSLVGEGLLGVWIDECGMIKDAVWNESIRPTLIDFAAPALLTGTPKGKNWFYDQFQKGLADAGIGRVASFGGGELTCAGGITGATSENPLLDQAEVAELAAEMTERLHRQEILARFLDAEGAVFKQVRERVYAGLGPHQRTACLGVDLARRHDWTVLVGMDADGRVTYFDRFRDIDYPVQKERIKRAWVALDYPALCIDATHGSVGDPVVQDLQYDGIFVEPFEFTGKSKVPLVEGLIIAMEQGRIILPDEPRLLNELETFEYTVMPHSGYTRYEAPQGKHDDCVMALAMAYKGAMRYGDSGVTF